jgi:hypothetical protein
MQLDGHVARRFQSSVARLEPWFDRVAVRFFERLRRDCPQMLRVVPTWTKRNRFDMAAWFGDFVKNVEHPGERLAWLRGAFASVGATEQDLRIMQKALLHEVKAAAADEWNAQMESDWGEVLQFVFAQMRMDGGVAMRKAA